MTGHAAATRGSAAPRPPPPRSSVEPLDAERARLHLTVSRRLLAKLEAAKAALSHARLGASSEEVLEAALDALLAQRAKRKGFVAKPWMDRFTRSGREARAAVRREPTALATIAPATHEQTTFTTNAARTAKRSGTPK